MYNPAVDLAARRALISSGIVGLTTALLTKTLKVDIGVSLPVGVATAITLDYIVNRETDVGGLRVAATKIGDYIQSEIGNLPRSTRTTFEEQLLTGITALLAGATISIGNYLIVKGYGQAVAGAAAGVAGALVVPEPEGREVAVGGEAGRIAALGAAGWGLYGRYQLSGDLARFGNWLWNRFQQEEEANPLVNLHRWADEYAADLMGERRGAHLFVPDDAGLEDLVDRLPGVPNPDPGRVAMFTADDGTEVALAWDSPSQPDSSVRSRSIPVIRLRPDTLTSVSETMSRLGSAQSGIASRESSASGTGTSSSDPSVMRTMARAAHYGLDYARMLDWLRFANQFFSQLTTVTIRGQSYIVIAFMPTTGSLVTVILWNPDPDADDHFHMVEADFNTLGDVVGGERGPMPIFDVLGDDFDPGDTVWWNPHTLGTPETIQREEAGVVIGRSADMVTCMVGFDTTGRPEDRRYMIALSYYLTPDEDTRSKASTLPDPYD